MENEIIIKQELSDKEKEIKNKFFNSKPKQDEHLQKNNLLLGATKTSLKDLKMFDELNKNSNEKKDEDIVDFQYKTGTDTYESLQDRLQKLHQRQTPQLLKSRDLRREQQL